MKFKYASILVVLICFSVLFSGCGKYREGNSAVDDTKTQFNIQSPKELEVNSQTIDTITTTTSVTTTTTQPKVTTTAPAIVTGLSPANLQGQVREHKQGIGDTFTYYDKQGKPVYSFKVNSMVETKNRDVNDKYNPQVARAFIINCTYTNINKAEPLTMKDVLLYYETKTSSYNLGVSYMENFDKTKTIPIGTSYTFNQGVCFKEDLEDYDFRFIDCDNQDSRYLIEYNFKV